MSGLSQSTRVARTSSSVTMAGALTSPSSVTCRMGVGTTQMRLTVVSHLLTWQCLFLPSLWGGGITSLDYAISLIHLLLCCHLLSAIATCHQMTPHATTYHHLLPFASSASPTLTCYFLSFFILTSPPPQL